MHVGMTGTRRGITEKQFNIFVELIEESKYLITHFHNGDAIGADVQSALIVKDINKNTIIVNHPPENPKYRAYGYWDEIREEKPYKVRDQDIVNESVYLFAFPHGEEIIRSGTWMTVRMARKKPTPISIIMPDGNITYE